MKKGIGPRALGSALKMYGAKTVAKKGKKPLGAGYASGDQAKMEKTTYQTDMLDAGKSRTQVYESTKGDKSKEAINLRENANREVGRTKRNYHISKMGGESLQTGEYEMAPMMTKTHSFRPEGANKLQPVAKPKKKRITPGNN